jgi:hypothetical protein
MRGYAINMWSGRRKAMLRNGTTSTTTNASVQIQWFKVTGWGSHSG